MLKITDLSLRRGSRLLLENVNLDVFPGQRIGLTGANGSGKSSLFAVIAVKNASRPVLPGRGDKRPVWILSERIDRSLMTVHHDGSRKRHRPPLDQAVRSTRQNLSVVGAENEAGNLGRVNSDDSNCFAVLRLEQVHGISRNGYERFRISLPG